MKQIKLYFTDFSRNFVIENDFFYQLLTMRYEIILDDKNPDYLIYSCYGNDFLKYNCIRIFYTAENIRPDFNLCDYALGFDTIKFSDRYIRLPNFARYDHQFPHLIRDKKIRVEDNLVNRNFCNFIYSSDSADPRRDDFFKLLSSYKKVDSLGKHLNNVEKTAGERYARNWRESKVKMQKNYKFSIAFENSYSPGYTSEKIMHAFISDTIPIYWGNPNVAEDFNTKAFINSHDFTSFNAVVERIIALDNDEDKYLNVLTQYPFINNTTPLHLKKETVLEFLNKIFAQPLKSAIRRPMYGTTVLYENDKKHAVRLKKRYHFIEKVINKIKSI